MTTPNTIAGLDVPLALVERAATVLEAAARTHSPSDRLAYRLDEYLVTHPDAVKPTVVPGWEHRIAQVEKTNRLWAIAAAFNTANPIGTPVTAYPGARPETHPNSCTRITTVTRSRATVLGGHTPVVWVDGHSACIALTHIDVRGEAS